MVSEEDIKCIEDNIKQSKRLFEEVGVYAYFDKENMTAVEKLIQGYRGLEENNIPKSVVEKQLDITMNERSMLGYKTFIKREDMIREDSILLGKEEAYKELLKGDK